jgi:hypothetical protein
MDSRADFFLRQIFKAFHKHPKQLPQITHALYIDAIKLHLSKLTNTKDKEFSSAIRKFLESTNLQCSETCAYLPNLDKPEPKRFY